MSRIPLERIDRCLTGACSQEERAPVDRWLRESPVHRAFMNALISDGSRGIAEARDEDASWERVRQRTMGRVTLPERSRSYDTPSPQAETWQDQTHASRPRSPGGRRVQFRMMWYGTVSLAAAVLFALAWWSKGVGRRESSSVAAATIYTTAPGQRATITLPDGNTVALNVASRLEIPANDAAGRHTLRLSGEALFTVRHHDMTPFTVIAGPATARVLGTSFVVRHYATDSVATVAVRDGKVAVHSVVLTAARQVEVRQDGAMRVSPADPAQFSFAAGVLTLGDTPLSVAAVELGRWYDADIRLGDPSLTTQRVKGKFAAGSLADLAAILEWTFEVRVVRDGRILTLYPRVVQ